MIRLSTWILAAFTMLLPTVAHGQQQLSLTWYNIAPNKARWPTVVNVTIVGKNVLLGMFEVTGEGLQLPSPGVLVRLANTSFALGLK